MEQFRCKAKGVKVEDLVEAADQLDINVAVLDDLLQLKMSEEP